MTDPSATELVHQAYFGWSYPPQLTLVSCSSDAKADQRRWNSRFKEHIRLEGVPADEKSYTALSYLNFGDGEAAILYRVGDGYGEARNNSHALIGSERVLTPTVALGMEKWSRWRHDRPNDQWMQSLTSSLFDDVDDDALAQRMLPLASGTEGQILTLIAVLLKNPEANLSVIGCPREERVPLLWGLRGAMDDHLRQRGVRRRWTFSTHEVRHDDAVEHLPEIIFLPSRTKDVGFSSRPVVDLSHDVSSVQPDQQAIDLLTRFLRDPAQAAREPRYESVSAGVATAAGGQASQVPPGTAPRLPHTGVAAAHGTGPPHHGQLPSHKPPMDCLREATTAQEVLAALSRLATDTPRKQRGALRQHLDVDLVNRATKVVMDTTAEQLASMLMAAAYGPGYADLQNPPGAMTHLGTLVTEVESNDLARRLSGKGLPWGERQVERAAYLRWAGGKGHGMAAPVRGAGPAGAPRRGAPRERRNWAAVGIISCCVLAVLGLVFVLGVLVGSPSAESRRDNGAGGPTTGVPTSAGPDQPAPIGPQWTDLPRYGNVTVTPGDEQVVHSFVQTGESYYPQGVCTAADRANTWQCSRTPAPPAVAVASPVLVAYLVPASETRELQRHFADGAAIPLGAKWDERTPVLG